MPNINEVKSSLEVGFENGALPEKFLRYRGKETRAIPILPEFPYEDEQFEVVLLESSSVSSAAVKESHRVLRPKGYLFFMVQEAPREAGGYEMPDIYSLIRDGFDIVDVSRPPWWKFGRGGHTLTIVARKKTWKTYKGLAHDHTLPFSPFRNRS